MPMTNRVALARPGVLLALKQKPVYCLIVMKKSAANTSLNNLWGSILKDIKAEISAANYATWFSKTKLISHDSDQIVVAVPNTFTRKQLEQRFQKIIAAALSQNRVDPKTLVYDVQTPVRRRRPADKATIKMALNPQDPGGHPPQSTPETGVTHRYRRGLSRRYTLDGFVVGGCNDLAYAACQGVLGNPGNKYNPLFIYGGVGTGKTHLIQAVGNQLATTNPQLTIVYATIEQFVQEFTDSIRQKKTDHFAYRYRSVDVLIIDDIQFIANKEKTQEEFFHTFNILLEASKQVIISSDKRPEEIPTLEARLCSRFQMGMSVDVTTPDFETRCAIIQTKIGRSVDYGCVQFLATHFVDNVRELEGAVNKLEAYCTVKQIPMDLGRRRGCFWSVSQGSTATTDP